jgi:hypothetical protein
LFLIFRAFLLALPTEARQFADIKGLAPSLGNSGPFDGQRLFGSRPKPADPPERETAAPTDIGSGGKGDIESGGTFEDQTYDVGLRSSTGAQPPRIIATHFGLEAGEAGR